MQSRPLHRNPPRPTTITYTTTAVSSGRSRAHSLHGAAFARDPRIDPNPNTTSHSTWNLEVEAKHGLGGPFGWVRARRSGQSESGLRPLRRTALSDVRSAWPLLHGAQKIEFVGLFSRSGVTAGNPRSTVIVIEPVPCVV